MRYVREHLFLIQINGAEAAGKLTKEEARDLRTSIAKSVPESAQVKIGDKDNPVTLTADEAIVDFKVGQRFRGSDGREWKVSSVDEKGSAKFVPVIKSIKLESGVELTTTENNGEIEGLQVGQRFNGSDGKVYEVKEVSGDSAKFAEVATQASSSDDTGTNNEAAEDNSGGHGNNLVAGNIKAFQEALGRKATAKMAEVLLEATNTQEQG